MPSLGRGTTGSATFRRDFKTALNQVLTQYPAARVKTDKGGMLIGNSPTPMQSRHTIYLHPPRGKPPPRA